MGEERVNLAFRRVIETHRTAALPGATSLDLYRELQAVTPDSLRYLLHDLFAANTFWELETERATATQNCAGAWEVTLQVRGAQGGRGPRGRGDRGADGRVDPGRRLRPHRRQGAEFGETLYLQQHRIRSGAQTITVTVPKRAVRRRHRPLPPADRPGAVRQRGGGGE